ncbi:hypothetical protein IIA15_09565 [candidate division TA06 bacterium]|nr:hypothetical protein [candidate division TA06 bacterium]
MIAVTGRDEKGNLKTWLPLYSMIEEEDYQELLAIFKTGKIPPMKSEEEKLLERFKSLGYFKKIHREVDIASSVMRRVNGILEGFFKMIPKLKDILGRYPLTLEVRSIEEEAMAFYRKSKGGWMSGDLEERVIVLDKKSPFSLVHEFSHYLDDTVEHDQKTYKQLHDKLIEIGFFDSLPYAAWRTYNIVSEADEETYDRILSITTKLNRFFRLQLGGQFLSPGKWIRKIADPPSEKLKEILGKIGLTNAEKEEIKEIEKGASGRWGFEWIKSEYRQQKEQRLHEYYSSPQEIRARLFNQLFSTMDPESKIAFVGDKELKFRVIPSLKQFKEVKDLVAKLFWGVDIKKLKKALELMVTLIKGKRIKGEPGLVLKPSKDPRKRRWQKTIEEKKSKKGEAKYEWGDMVMESGAEKDREWMIVGVHQPPFETGYKLVDLQSGDRAHFKEEKITLLEKKGAKKRFLSLGLKKVGSVLVRPVSVKIARSPYSSARLRRVRLTVSSPWAP